MVKHGTAPSPKSTDGKPGEVDLSYQLAVDAAGKVHGEVGRSVGRSVGRKETLRFTVKSVIM